MNMKEHILMALQEQFGHWVELLESLSEAQITVPRFDDDWSIKDVIAHLWWWQQISVARMEAAALGREPAFPAWVASAGDWEDNVGQTNARIHANHHVEPWSELYCMWREGSLRLIASAEPAHGG